MLVIIVFLTDIPPEHGSAELVVDAPLALVLGQQQISQVLPLVLE